MSDKLFVGEVRPSQLMYTYGIGAIVDLPSLSVIVMGLDDWPQDTPVLSEPRLLNAVRYHVKGVEQLRVLPQLEVQPDSPFDSSSFYGVPVAVFPRWLLCPVCRTLAPISSGMFELEKHPYQPDRTVYRHNCTQTKGNYKPEAIPARILAACEEGHLDDFPWVEFVHKSKPCLHEKSQLQLLEYGPTGEARDLEVKCNCGARRRLSDAFGRENRHKMPQCNGRRPHLRDYDPATCDNHFRAIVLGATNLWFPVVLGVLSIPTKIDRLHQLVESHWNTLRVVQMIDFLQPLRQLQQIQGELADYTDEEIFAEIQAYQLGTQYETETVPDIKFPEWQVLSQESLAWESIEFRARRLASMGTTWAEMLKVQDVLLIDRLREVQATLGFARIDAVGELTDPDQQVLVRTAPLSRSKPKWLPATELRGEGIFIRFDEQSIQAWERQDAVREYSEKFLTAHMKWREKRGIQNPEKGFMGMRYVLLHSFSHALMRQIALESGYASASLKERIYARPQGFEGGPMAGVLIYTSASDSEGTLGGLVGLGENENTLYRLIVKALESLALCAGDPLCADHHVDVTGKTIHAAACHACLFSSETSCERGNKYLDRSVLIPTLQENSHMRAFFSIS